MEFDPLDKLSPSACRFCQTFDVSPSIYILLIRTIHLLVGPRSLVGLTDARVLPKFTLMVLAVRS